ncbi:MAG TPA: FAD-binding oxidoreductase [Longimicrobiales bacterium]|nr:FAD-binding oxidoreductase [Longimicrobiales bacterium]
MADRTEEDRTVQILHTGFVTHDVKQFVVTRPEGFDYQPGQGVTLAVDQGEWEGKGRPFTPTGRADEPVLEFTIKAYPARDGVTDKLHELDAGARLQISDPFGTIVYRGPGTFIAAGAGVTPFLAILRQSDAPGELEGCSLLFTNKSPRDVIAEKELRHLLGDRLHLTCTRTSAPGYDHRRLDRSYLEERVEDPSGRFYVCGPPEFVEDTVQALTKMGAARDRIVLEE